MKIKKIICFPLVLFGGILGALGGSENSNKNIRRIGLPLFFTLSALNHSFNLYYLSIMSMSLFLSLGYGIPCYNDRGSAVGRFWYKILKGKYFWVNVCVRGTKGIGIIISLLCLPLINNSWLIYGIGSGLVILSESLLSWRNLGSIKTKKYTLCVSDILTYSIITGYVFSLIYL